MALRTFHPHGNRLDQREEPWGTVPNVEVLYGWLRLPELWAAAGRLDFAHLAWPILLARSEEKSRFGSISLLVFNHSFSLG